MGFLDWLRGKKEEKPREEGPRLVKETSAEREQVQAWVDQIRRSLFLLREDLKRLPEQTLDKFNKTFEDKTPEIIGRLKDIQKDTGKIPLIKKNTDRIPDIEKNIISFSEDVKKAIEEEISKVKLTPLPEKVKIGKPPLPIVERLTKRIDELAYSFIPRQVEDLLSKNENMSFTELLGAVGTSKPTLSKHLQRMMKMGIVVKSKVGRRTYYRLAAIKERIG